MFGISKAYIFLAFLGMFIHILMKILDRKDKIFIKRIEIKGKEIRVKVKI
jgi:hypothetical protein